MKSGDVYRHAQWRLKIFKDAEGALFYRVINDPHFGEPVPVYDGLAGILDTYGWKLDKGSLIKKYYEAISGNLG